MVLYDRMKYLSPILLIICFSPSNSQQQTVTRPEVTILQGTLRGTTTSTRHNRTVFSFLSIPYAKPPTGNLRFANPVAAESWNGTLDASVDRNVCPQNFLGTAGAEDCLTMNVYTPQLPKNGSSTLLPVMVWVHGGGFMFGSHNSDMFEPEYLLDADVVLAAPNYRLGPFGFLSTGDEVASGNWALKDLVLALQWVQNNIEFFGGDPNQVTLFGQSAGAACVHLLTLSNATIGLFHRYILHSGSALAPWSYQPRAKYARHAYELGKYVGCANDTSATLISCLRGVNVSHILDSSSQFTLAQSPLGIVWSPTDESDIEGAVLTDSPTNIFATGGIRDLPSISGVVRNEGVLHTLPFYFNTELLTEFLDKFDTSLPKSLMLIHQPDRGAAWVGAIKAYYFNNDLTTNKSQVLSNLTILGGDASFFYPAYRALKQQLALAINPQYFYLFNYKGTLSYTLPFTGVLTVPFVGHTDDLIYLFPSRGMFSSFDVDRSEADFEMVDSMVELWTSFAINGTPTTTAQNNSVIWEAYNSRADNYLRIGNDTDVGLEVQYSFFKERMAFWDTLYSATSTSNTLHNGTAGTETHA